MIVTCPECNAEFDRVVPHQQRCGKPDCDRAATRRRVKAYRDRHRKKGGGGGGNGGGGGAPEPTLFDTITPVDERSVYVPDTCYRTPDQSEQRKPAVRISQKSLKAAA